jgi:hypothetical protein
MPQKKPFPPNPSLELQRDLLLNPERNPTGYVAFEDASAHPFAPGATTWSRVNGWWLADASWLAYAHDETMARAILAERAGLTSCTFLSREGTQCYIAHNSQLAIVAFRGTEPDDWHDLFDISRFVPIPWDVGRVHQGFAAALDKVWPQLHAALLALPGTCRIWLTGHSLGAALASMTAVRIGSRASGVYTYGAPRIGTAAFASRINDTFRHTSIRYVNDHDVVTDVPPPEFALPSLYTHADHERWIDEDGGIGTGQPTGLDSVLADVLGGTALLLQLIQLCRQGVLISLPDTLTDHTPLYYALHTWNDFAENGG